MERENELTPEEIREEQELNAHRLGMSLEDYLQTYQSGLLGSFGAKPPTPGFGGGILPSRRPGHISPDEPSTRATTAAHGLDALRHPPEEDDFQKI